MSKRKVVVIGGGMVGLCSAWYLRQQGHQVTVIERDTLGEGCSLGNAGMLVPSHFIPMAAPGIIAKGLKWMFQPESPFNIRPTLDVQNMLWLWSFFRSANQTHVDRCKQTILDLNLYSRELYETLSSHDGLDFEIGEHGLFMLYRTEKGEQEEIEIARQARELGLDIDILDGQGVQALEPDVRVDVRGGVHFRCDSHIDPGHFMQTLIKGLTHSDTQLLGNTEAVGFEQDDQGRITAVMVRSGDNEITALKADEFVLAAGSFSKDIAKLLGDNLPVIPGKGYSLTLDNPEKVNRIPAIMTEAKVTITPMGDSLRFCGTMELLAGGENINEAKVRGLRKAVGQYYPDFAEDLMKADPVWSGMRPCSPDGMPYIGRFRKHENLIAATGHAMMGVSLGPATGKMVSDIVSGTPETRFNMSLMSPDR